MTEDVVLSGPLEKMRGVIGRYPEEGQHYVFEYDRVAPAAIHMLFVRRPLDVSWYVDDELVHRGVLEPWTGFGVHKADKVIEERP